MENGTFIKFTVLQAAEETFRLGNPELKIAGIGVFVAMKRDFRLPIFEQRSDHLIGDGALKISFFKRRRPVETLRMLVGR